MTPNEILNKRFDKAAVGGYRTDDVHAYLLLVSDYVSDLLKDQKDMEKKMVFLAEKIEEYREDEESLQAALVGAQKLGESVVREAREEASRLVVDAGERANATINSAQKEADTLLANAKLQIDTEAYTLNRMQTEVARFKKNLLGMYQKQIELINALPYDEHNTPEPMSRPTLAKMEKAEVDTVTSAEVEATEDIKGVVKEKVSSIPRFEFRTEKDLSEFEIEENSEDIPQTKEPMIKEDKRDLLEYGEGFRLTDD